MSSLCCKLVAYISFITFVHAIIIFNNDNFIIDIPFEKIKSAVTSGNMKCGLGNEGVKLHQNKYNGSHIIFSYEQICDIRSMLDYANKEDIYFNEFMKCNIHFLINLCNGRPDNFKFIDTCSIGYHKACEEGFLGPCVPSPSNPSTSTILQLGNDTVEFTTEEIQRAIGHDVVTCDPNRIKEMMRITKTYFEIIYKKFRYGRQKCVLEKRVRGMCPVEPGSCCYPAVYNVQHKYGQKLNTKAVKKAENFNK